MKIALLKGRDYAKAAALQQACKNTDMCLFLASVEKHEYIPDEEVQSGHSGDEDEEDWPPPNMNGEHEIEWALTGLFDEDGQKLRSEHSIDEESIVQANAFADREPDDQKEKWAGNEGGGSELWYRCSV